jgi:hypothetical protein
MRIYRCRSKFITSQYHKPKAGARSSWIQNRSLVQRQWYQWKDKHKTETKDLTITFKIIGDETVVFNRLEGMGSVASMVLTNSVFIRISS